jgi:hypothetical protein
VSEVVLEAVALGLQRVDVFVLGLLASACRLHALLDILLAEEVAADHGRTKALLALEAAGGQIDSVHVEAVVGVAQPHPVDPAIAVMAMLLACPASEGLLSCLAQLLQAGVTCHANPAPSCTIFWATHSATGVRKWAKGRLGAALVARIRP